jgi:hypothetical protein
LPEHRSWQIICPSLSDFPIVGREERLANGPEKKPDNQIQCSCQGEPLPLIQHEGISALRVSFWVWMFLTGFSFLELGFAFGLAAFFAFPLAGTRRSILARAFSNDAVLMTSAPMSAAPQCVRMRPSQIMDHLAGIRSLLTHSLVQDHSLCFIGPPVRFVSHCGRSLLPP